MVLEWKMIRWSFPFKMDTFFIGLSVECDPILGPFFQQNISDVFFWKNYMLFVKKPSMGSQCFTGSALNLWEESVEGWKLPETSCCSLIWTVGQNLGISGQQNLIILSVQYSHQASMFWIFWVVIDFQSQPYESLLSWSILLGQYIIIHIYASPDHLIIS